MKIIGVTPAYGDSNTVDSAIVELSGDELALLLYGAQSPRPSIVNVFGRHAPATQDICDRFRQVRNIEQRVVEALGVPTVLRALAAGVENLRETIQAITAPAVEEDDEAQA